MIIGQPASGKSTLARLLGARTGLPVGHLDHIHRQPGWVPRPEDDKIRLIRAEEEKPACIIEGGLSRTWDTRLARANMLVWINVGLALRLWRVLARSWRFRGRSRPDMTAGCPEHFDRDTLVFLWFILRTWRPGLHRMCRVFAARDRPEVELRSLAQTRAWLAAL
ncbi:MAG: hypothetical protein AAFP13_06875 [Pseudomonadota bacterium]